MLLEVQNVSKRYAEGWFKRPSQAVVNGVSFTLSQGESVGLVGESGSGKSTLARLICGIEPADLGQIWLKGKPITDRANRQRHLSVVFQDYLSAVNPTMTVWQAISEPLQLQGVPKKFHRELVAEWLPKVRLSCDVLDRYLPQLSGGQAQRVNLCRALISQPSLIVLDEALSSLDLATQVQLLDLLQDLKAEFGLSYLFITHNLQTLCYLCDRALFFQQGEIVEQCDIAQLKNVQTDYARRLLQAVL